MPGLPEPLPAGIPSERAYVADYCRALGRPMLSETQMRFLLVLSYFRAAAIMIGVYARSLQGNASSASAHLAADQYVAPSFASFLWDEPLAPAKAENGRARRIRGRRRMAIPFVN